MSPRHLSLGRDFPGFCTPSSNCNLVAAASACGKLVLQVVVVVPLPLPLLANGHCAAGNHLTDVQ